MPSSFRNETECLQLTIQRNVCIWESQRETDPVLSSGEMEREPKHLSHHHSVQRASLSLFRVRNRGKNLNLIYLKFKIPVFSKLKQTLISKFLSHEFPERADWQSDPWGGSAEKWCIKRTEETEEIKRYVAELPLKFWTLRQQLPALVWYEDERGQVPILGLLTLCHHRMPPHSSWKALPGHSSWCQCAQWEESKGGHVQEWGRTGVTRETLTDTGLVRECESHQWPRPVNHNMVRTRDHWQKTLKASGPPWVPRGIGITASTWW